MSEAVLSKAEQRRSLVAVIASMAVVNLVYGLSLPLLALVLDSQGIDKTMIGLSTMAQAGAVFAIAPLAPRLMLRIGPARLMQAATLVAAVVFLLLPAFANLWAWFPLRFVLGAAGALLWIASEAMINELAEERWRGRLIGIYSAAGAAGFSLGPLLLIATGSSGALPFVATSALILIAGLPLFLAARTRPAVQDEGLTSLLVMVWIAPTIMLVNLAYAAAAESLGTFFPLFGLRLGLSEAGSLSLLTVMGIGAIVLAMPFGWLADHVNRLGLLIACLLVTMAALLVMPALIALPLVAPIFAFLYGGIEGMIYALGVILMGERFRGAALAAASTTFTAMWGAGTMLGPPLVGAGMDALGSETMPYLVCLLFAAYLPLPLASLLRARRGDARPGA